MELEFRPWFNSLSFKLFAVEEETVYRILLKTEGIQPLTYSDKWALLKF